MDQTFLIEFGIILIVAAGLGVVARLLKQPLILAYLIAGVIIGPFALGIVKNTAIIQTFADIGIVFLLFLIGLELNPRRLIEVGKSAVAIAIVQIIVSGFIYFLAATKFGLGTLAAIYLAIGFTFSSTAIIVTLLSDRKDLDSLHGKILVGILLIQDFVAILVLTAASGLSANTGNLASYLTYQILFKAIILFLLTYLIGRFILPPIFTRIARSQELLFLSGLAWCFFLAIAALALGFSASIGAFLAGITLAPLSFAPHIATKTKPLRDFFITIFFIYLGTTLVFSNISNIIIPAIVFALLILLVNPLVVVVTMSLLGYRKRTSFVTAISLTQVSEFCFIVVALGTKLKILPEQTMALASIVAIVTIFISTYLIKYANKLYHLFRPSLELIESDGKRDELMNLDEKIENHIILIGYHRIGEVVYEDLIKKKEKVLVVDVDPRRIEQLIEEKKECIYGDAIDHDIIERINIGHAKMVISTIDRAEEELLIIVAYKKINPKLKYICVAESADEAEDLYKGGADFVLVPTLISGDYLNHILNRISDHTGELEKIKTKEVEALA